MTRKQMILGAIAITGVGSFVCAFLYMCNPRESERCFDAIEIGTSYDDVDAYLMSHGFIMPARQSLFEFSFGPLQDGTFHYTHDQDCTEIRIEIENGCLSDKRIRRPEPFVMRSWKRIIGLFHKEEQLYLGTIPPIPGR